MRSVMLAAVVAVVLPCVLPAAEPESGRRMPVDGNPRTVYLSTGDNQDVLAFAPLDSIATVEAAFDALKQYRVDRIWWRGGQDEIWGKQFLIRKENRMFWRIWEWWKDNQYRKAKLNRVAVEAAHKRGMEIWLTYGLFDNGSQADAGYAGFPYAAEDRLRIEHPEWAPVNKWGTWRQGGPVEFAYPEARKAMADYLTKFVIEGGYDGLSFLTYAENFSQRYEDEFGYSEPIVKEFQRRYGVNILREKFNKEKWSRLRGEYVEKFLRELRSRLAEHGKKLAIVVDGHDPNRPTKWTFDGGVRTAGSLQWDAEEWLKNETVDEMCLFSKAEESEIQRRENARQKQKSKMIVSAFRTRGKLPPGMSRIMWLGRDIETGFDWEAWVDWPDEKLTVEPAASLTGEDVFARRRTLTCALKGKTKLSLKAVADAAKDPDVFVRRMAMRVLAERKDPASIPPAVAALKDPENSVRVRAVLALGELKDPEIVPRILAAISHQNSTFQFHFRAVPEVLKKRASGGRLTAADKELMVARLTDPQARIRELVLYYFTLVGAPGTLDVRSQLLKIIREDSSPYARELAMINLRSSFGAVPLVTNALKEVMARDKDHAVQARAAVALATAHARNDASHARKHASEVYPAHANTRP
ncbi:MAG: HEAT repeat domain-containing protein, partial [Planctomycetes bacterium]|nr:HEAT repeat domain-containing protein [Planctomycetota bacterium]